MGDYVDDEGGPRDGVDSEAYLAGYKRGFLDALAAVQHERAAEWGAVRLSVRLEELNPEWGAMDWLGPYGDALNASVQGVMRGFDQGHYP